MTRFELRELPESMIVLGGGGPVAAEFAQFFCRLGTRTTLIQRSDHLFSSTDEDLARPVEGPVQARGNASLHRDSVAKIHATRQCQNRPFSPQWQTAHDLGRRDSSGVGARARYPIARARKCGRAGCKRVH